MEEVLEEPRDEDDVEVEQLREGTASEARERRKEGGGGWGGGGGRGERASERARDIRV